MYVKKKKIEHLHTFTMAVNSSMHLCVVSFRILTDSVKRLR